MKALRFSVLAAALLAPAAALAQPGPFALCTPLFNSGTGAVSCVPVGQTSPNITAPNPLPVGGIANAAAPTFVEGRAGYLSFTLGGALRVDGTFTPAATQDVNLTQILGAAPSATNPLWVSPATASTPWTVGGAAASGAALSGNPVRVGMSDGTNAQNWLAAIALADGVNGNNTGAVANWLWNGATYDRQPGTTKGSYEIIRDAAGNARGANVTAANALSSDVTSIAGTATVNGGAAGTLGVGGTVATNVAITANPLNLGAQGVSSENAAVTTARQVQLVADLVGKLIVLPYANPENFVSGLTAAMTGTTSTSLIAAPAGSLRNYLTHLICTNSHATVGTFVIVQDGSGGTTIYEGYAAAVGGGFSITLPAALRQPTAATALFVQDVTTGANVICSGSGYKGL